MLKKFKLKSKSVIRNFYANIICPQTCIICKEKTFSGIPVCQNCITKELELPCDFQLKNPDKFCGNCGKLLISEKNFCTSCRTKIEKEDLSFYDKVFAIYPYQGMGGKILRQWKNQNVRSIAELFSASIFHFVNSKEELKNINIVPVPPRPKKLKTKGWDQIEDMACILESFYGINISRYLKREDGTSQKSLSKEKRKTNLKGKIHLKNNGIILPEKLIILDDVITTGATLNFCAQVLKDAGCKKVYCLCLFFD